MHSRKDRSYVVMDYLEREEENFTVIFLKQSGKYFVLNRTAIMILDTLKKGKSFNELLFELSKLFDVGADAISAYLERFLKKLEAECVVKMWKDGTARSEIRMQFTPPSMEPLSLVFDKDQQCLSFGMPKRSCKGLPSGAGPYIE